MPRITISAKATAYEGNPHDHREITDPVILKKFHGADTGDDVCEPHISQGLAVAIGLKGGRIRFAFSDKANQLAVTTTYGVDHKPDQNQLQQLVQETQAQWSDGLGSSSFSTFDTDYMSANLGKALINEHPEILQHLPPFFLDAAPDDAGQPKISWSDTGGPDDFLINDAKVAAQAGHPYAQAFLGFLYQEGEVMEADTQKSIEWFKKSADQENEMGYTHLGFAYLEGKGVPVDLQTGIQYMQKAANLDSTLALHTLGEAYKEGKYGLENQPEKGIPYLERAVAMDFAPCKAELGDCYEYGIGVKKDLKKALALYADALEDGFEPVEPAFQRVKKQVGGGFFSRLFGRS